MTEHGGIGNWKAEIREMEETIRQMRRRIASLRKAIDAAEKEALHRSRCPPLISYR